MANPVGYSLDRVLVQYYQLEQARVAAQEALEAAAGARDAMAQAQAARLQVPQGAAQEALDAAAGARDAMAEADAVRPPVPRGAADDSAEKGAANSWAIRTSYAVKRAADKAIAAMNAADAVLETVDPEQAPPPVVAMARGAAYEALNAAEQAQAAGQAAAEAGQGHGEHARALANIGGSQQRVTLARNQFTSLGDEVAQPEELPRTFPTPMLCLSRTAEGEERLIVRQDKREVPWYYRLLAFFGLGHASLNSVAAHLRDHQGEIHVFNPEAPHENSILVDRAVQWINQKMVFRNEGSRIQHIDPLTLVAPVILQAEHCAGATSSTAPEDLMVEHTPLNTQGEISDEFHNLDRFLAYPEKGMFVLGDATGHHEDRMKRIIVVDHMWERIDALMRDLPPPHTFVEAIRSLENIIKIMNTEWSTKAEEQEAAISSSLIIAWMLRDNEGQSYLVYAAVGDSDLYLLPREGHLRQITPVVGPHRDCEIGMNCKSPLIDIMPVHPEDRVFALTDGIHGHMANRVLEEIARNVSLEGLCAALTQAVIGRPLDELVPDHEQIREGEYIPGEAACLDLKMERDPANAKKPYQPTKDDGSFNKHGCDDTGAVGMIVPANAD